MIEKILLDHLKRALSVPVYMEVPKDPASSFVKLEKTGGGCEKHIFSAMIAVQSYATTLWKAAELNERVKEAMETACALDEICRIQLNSDYNFTDTASKRYRYQAVYDVTHY